MSIEGVQKSTEQIEGGSREGAAGHEVEGNDGEDNPGITLGWQGRGTGCDRGASSWSLALRWCWGRREHSPMRLGTNRKIFSSGILAAPLVALVQLWRCKDLSQSHQRGLTFQPGTSAAPPEPWAQFPRAIPAVRARRVPGRGTPLGAVPAHLVFRWAGAASPAAGPVAGCATKLTLLSGTLRASEEGESGF